MEIGIQPAQVFTLTFDVDTFSGMTDTRAAYLSSDSCMPSTRISLCYCLINPYGAPKLATY